MRPSFEGADYPLKAATRSISKIRWDEKAGLRTGCCTLPVINVLKAQETKETGNEEG
jgi:hypothetical protein